MVAWVHPGRATNRQIRRQRGGPRSRDGGALLLLRLKTSRLRTRAARRHVRICRFAAGQATNGSDEQIFGARQQLLTWDYPLLTRRSWANRRLNHPTSRARLVILCQNLFVAARVAWVHPGLPRIGKSNMTAGQPRSERVKFSRAAKAKRRRHYRWLTRRSLANRRLTLAPKTCCFVPNICSSLPWWLGFTQACREPANQGTTAGSPRSECVRFSGAARAKRHRSYPWYPPLPPSAELLLCAKHLVVAAMVAGFTRASRDRQKQNMMAGQPACGAGKFSWAARAKRAAVPPWRRRTNV